MQTPPPNPLDSDLLARLRSGDPRWLARAITAVVEDHDREGVLRALYPAAGQARVVGVTGPPGSGKSTLVDALARRYRQAGESVGIVAVDPSSPFSGGAILGDRIRMQAHHADPGLFIRSLASRGALGGLAESAHAVVTVLDAAGKQRVLVETVGVGQDEVDVVQLADVTVLVLVPGMGDAVQSLKAGVMEIADIFVINKADRGADALEQEIRGMQSLAPAAGAPAWRAPIIQTVATTGAGVAELEAAITRRLEWMSAQGGLQLYRAAQWRQRLPQLARDRLAARVLAPQLTPDKLGPLAEALAAGANPYDIVDRIFEQALIIA